MTDSQATLESLIDDGQRFDAEYGRGLANHLPMALSALHRLGADGERLVAFASVQARHLEPARPAAEWPAGDPWRGRFGERAAWPAYRPLFLQWLEAEGAESVLRQALPPLMQGCGGAAFHGLIRTAHAVHTGLGQELADALAYWACSWLDLGTDAGEGKTSDPWRVLGALAIDVPAGDLIVDRMGCAAADPAFAPAAARLRIDGEVLARLARLAARLYARSGNFTALHLVTSAHAMRVLLLFVDEPLPALAAYWRAFAAGFVASGAVLGRAPAPRPWTEIVAAALASDDEHLVKLVDACREEEQARGGTDDWQRAATRAVAGLMH